ncbi:MAG: IclR family transcriptional regulator [Firmicutes bacterium]|nr:IclR family transcriptional regulator [Bacillota bacterium]
METTENGKTKYVVPAIEKAFAVLEFVVNSDTGCTFNEIIDAIKLPKTTAFTVINSLVSCGYIEKSADKLFVPTIKLYSMGMKARNSIIKTHIFLEPLEGLRNATGFTAFLSIYDRGERVVIEKVDGYGALMLRAHIGERANLNTSSSGKAIAAYLDEDELNLVLSKGLKKVTNNSIYEKDRFIEHLELIRKQGYSLDDGEDDISLRCLGLPVFMSGNAIFGSVSISTTKENLPIDNIKSYLSILRMTAENISLKLGFEGNYSQRLWHK